MASAFTEPNSIPVDLTTIQGALERIRSLIHQTPVLTSAALDQRSRASIFLKSENFQRVGAFKFRGALNAVLQLTQEERTRGVVTHSSGNHAQAISLAGSIAGIPTCVVMPRTAPSIKKAATEGYGARVVLCEPTLEARESTVDQLIKEHGYCLIHPYDNWNVIAGAGTAALEFMEQVGPFDIILAPVGGGGLMAGTCLAVAGRSPSTRLIGTEPANADDALRSLQLDQIQPSDDPTTVADGLRTALGVRPFVVLQKYLEQIVTVTETEILEAMRFIWERLNIIIEPSCAVPIAALFSGRIPDASGKRIGVILTGGNVDLEPFFQNLQERWIDID